MGDAICYSRVLELYRQSFPKAHLRFITYYPKLFEADPNVNEVVKLHWKGRFPSESELINCLSVTDWKDKNLTIELCKAAGFSITDNSLCPKYYITPEEYAAANKLLAKYRCRIVFHPRGRNFGFSSAWFSEIKNWPATNWSALTQRLKEAVIVIGSDDDFSINGTIDLRSRVSLRMAAAIASAANVFVTCDSGFYWVTASSPAKRVLLLGKRRNPTLFVRNSDSVLVGQMECKYEHCNSYWSCPLTGQDISSPCISSITVDEVHAQIIKMLD